jgi:ABC-type transport system involved in cytochrome c biogenesis permease subunit
MIPPETAKMLEVALVCLWIGASLGGFGLLWLGGRRGLLAFLKAELAIQGIASAVLGGILLVPMILGREQAVDPDEHAKVEYPPFDSSFWRSLVVQAEGRKKPLESAAVETLRNITSRSKYQKKDAVTILLQWMMLNGEGLDGNKNTWEREPFILCPDGDLRERIYRELLGPDTELTDEHIRGKHISPEELRKSSAFLELLLNVRQKRMEDSEKWMQLISPAERKAFEVEQRLGLFDRVSQNNPTTFGKLEHRERPEDPIGIVALDRRGGAWFSIGQLRDLKKADGRARDFLESKLAEPVVPPLAGLCPDFALADLMLKATQGAQLAERLHHHSAWREVMKERLAHVPQLYISPERLKSLEEFQAQVKAGTAQKALDELAVELQIRRQERVQEIEASWTLGDSSALLGFLQEQTLTVEDKLRLLRSRDFAQMYRDDQQRFIMFLGALLEVGRSSDESKRQMVMQLVDDLKDGDKLPTLAQRIAAILAERDQKVIDDLERRVASAKKNYHPEDDRFRMLHLNYLESRFPNIYIESAAWQPYPRAAVNLVLDSFEKVQKAYRSADPETFEKASQEFFATVRGVSEQYDTVNGYPGIDTADLELKFNRIQPFMWGWITMLLSILLLSGSLVAGHYAATGTEKSLYGLGWLLYAVSLGFQAFGFYARIAIAGRAPVSNMYETVIFVAAMSAVFAMVLEFVYRKKIILLGGAAAAWAALILADQLPAVLDPKISPLVPVLRSNYWLIIHVLTIVASYAGGALAWVIGNIALGMIAFGNPKRDTLKTLSQFSYRAMQIAVLLLAAGTFLGGWWAAESWGRFWGWDPKEVWALISLVCYVIPLHARYVGWVKDFGLAVSAVLCFAAIMMSWYGVNFVLGAGLHSYGFGGGGPWWVAWVALLNLVYVIVCCLIHVGRATPSTSTGPSEA